MARALFLFACMLCCFRAMAQDEWREDFKQRTGALNSYLRYADTLSDEQRWADTLDVNEAIAELLIAALEVPGLPDAAIDTAFIEGPFSMAASIDKRLRIFSWDERTGGTFRSNSNVLFVRAGAGVWTMHSTPDREDDPLCGIGAAYSGIHQLHADKASGLYLCMGSVVGCSTCCAEVLVVIAVTGDTLDLAFPAFPPQDENGQGSPCFVLDARCGDVEDFSYDPRKRILRFAYTTDDLTPERSSEGEAPRTVKGQLRFNGTAFVQE